MKRGWFALMLAVVGMSSVGCCGWHPYCCAGCGERARLDWWINPPTCCNPCDNCGNFQGCGSCGGGCGGGSCGSCCDSGCGDCGSCGSSCCSPCGNSCGSWCGRRIRGGCSPLAGLFGNRCCSRGLFGNGCCGGIGPACGYGGYHCNTGYPGGGGYPCGCNSGNGVGYGDDYSSYDNGYGGTEEYVDQSPAAGAEMARQPAPQPTITRTSSRSNTGWRPQRQVRQAQYNQYRDQNQY